MKMCSRTTSIIFILSTLSLSLIGVGWAWASINQTTGAVIPIWQMDLSDAKNPEVRLSKMWDVSSDVPLPAIVPYCQLTFCGLEWFQSVNPISEEEEPTDVFTPARLSERGEILWEPHVVLPQRLWSRDGFNYIEPDGVLPNSTPWPFRDSLLDSLRFWQGDPESIMCFAFDGYMEVYDSQIQCSWRVPINVGRVIISREMARIAVLGDPVPGMEDNGIVLAVFERTGEQLFNTVIASTYLTPPAFIGDDYIITSVLSQEGTLSVVACDIRRGTTQTVTAVEPGVITVSDAGGYIVSFQYQRGDVSIYKVDHVPAGLEFHEDWSVDTESRLVNAIFLEREQALIVQSEEHNAGEGKLYQATVYGKGIKPAIQLGSFHREKGVVLQGALVILGMRNSQSIGGLNPMRNGPPVSFFLREDIEDCLYGERGER